jgi:hypothetical protein
MLVGILLFAGSRRLVPRHGAPGGQFSIRRWTLSVARCALNISVTEMKRYLITGTRRGIGRAIAEKLAGPDIELLLHGRDTVALAEVCNAVKHHCAHVVSLFALSRPADVTLESISISSLSGNL